MAFGWFGLGKEIAKPIEAFGQLYTTDKARLEAQKNFQDVMQKPVLAQLEINKIFSGSWQHLIAWTAGFLVLIYYAPQIIIITYVWGKACIASGVVTKYPMEPDDILNLVWLLFGFGIYHLADTKISK